MQPDEDNNAPLTRAILPPNYTAIPPSSILSTSPILSGILRRTKSTPNLFFPSSPKAKAKAKAQPTSGTTAMTRSAKPTPCEWKPLPSPFVSVRHSPKSPSIHRPEICPSLRLTALIPRRGDTHTRDSRPGFPLPIWPIAMNLLPFPHPPPKSYMTMSTTQRDEQSCMHYTSSLPLLDGIQSLRFSSLLP